MAQVTIDEAFKIALQHHRAGQLPQAEVIAREILGQQPNHADALHLLGVISYQLGRHDKAVDLIRQAIAVHPGWPEAYNNLGVVLKNQGRPEEAAVACRRAIALNPNMSEAHCNLGNALRDRRQLDEAARAYRQAIALKPSYAEAHGGLGNALRDMGQLDEAIAAYGQAVRLSPGWAEAHSNLGIALRDAGRLDEAVAAYRQAIALKPDYAAAHNNLGVALKDQGYVDEAIGCYGRAIGLDGHCAVAHLNLGVALSEKGEIDGAIAAFRQGIALRPSAEAYSNLAAMLRMRGENGEALEWCRKAIAMAPDLASAHHNLGLTLRDMGEYGPMLEELGRALALNPGNGLAHWVYGLALTYHGRLAEAWQHCEWRWRDEKFPIPHRSFSQPLWDGSELAGRTILLHAEQGFGDTIHFLRYAPLVARRGGRVVVECQPELGRLLEGSLGVGQWVMRGEALPAFDVQCPLVRLPAVFGTTMETIPREVPYIRAAGAAVEGWRRRLAERKGRLKVGLVWAGRPTHEDERWRSMRLSSLGRLGCVAGVDFYSLQKGAAAAEADSAPAGLGLTDWTGELSDFVDTAALVAALDLVIAVDTSIVHLAGAMARPVWTMVSAVCDWRWMLGREESPWYPTMRLFRQTRLGDWGPVVERVAAELGKLAQNEWAIQGSNL